MNIPEDWPTKEMIREGQATLGNFALADEELAAAFLAMVLAAPADAFPPLPEGWTLISIDTSFPGVMRATIKRIHRDDRWWESLSEQERERTQLYVTGCGPNIAAAIIAAVGNIVHV